MVRNDVVTNPRVNRRRDVRLECLRQQRGFLMRMFYVDAAAREMVCPHRLEQFGAGGREWMRGFVAQELFEITGRRDGDAFFDDESPEAAAEAFGTQRAREQGEMNMAPGFIPRAERSGGDILLHVLFRAAEERELPIVDR